MSISQNKAAILDWEAYRENIRKATFVDLTETLEDKRARIKRLEADPQAWKEYYFKKFFSSESPEFHKRASKRLITNFLKKGRWYEVRHWVRGLSKTTTAMMDCLYLILTGKLKNIVYTSATYDAAEKFLTKWQAQLDSNQKIINDYGKQELEGSWEKGLFKTRSGVQFMALGAGQSPRGNGNDEIRPDCIICDDFDTDQECENPEIINKKWRWFETALFFCIDISRPYLILWLGNIIAPDCCVVRAGKMADSCEIINVRDAQGKSVWPEKNSEEAIDEALSRVSYEAGQQEMFNNPMRQGQTFKEITWGKCPNMHLLPFIVQYADPSTSNNDRPALKSRAQNSCKAIALIGFYANTWYLYKCFVDNTTNSTFIEWMYVMWQYVGNRTALLSFIENNSLQDPFFQQVLLPLIYQMGQTYGFVLPVTPDEEKKGGKWFRVEGDLEPEFRNGRFVFNEEEKDCPHMQRMAAQFLTAHINSKTLDGPDACQGAVHKTKTRSMVQRLGSIESIPRKPNSRRW